MKKLLLLLVCMMGTVQPILLSDLWIFSPSKKAPVIVRQKVRVAVVKIADSIDMDESANRLYTVAKDKTVSAILLVFDCSGGPAAEFSVIHDLIKKVSKLKPVIALIKSRALSGGYLAASAADYIMAHSYSEIGNIGVVCRIERFKNPKVSDRVEADLSVEVFTDSDLKTIYDPFEKDLTAEHRDYLKNRMVIYSNHFRNTVATNRNLSMDDVKQWSDGKVFIAHEALELRLIDEIGTIFEVDKNIISLLSKRNPKVMYADEVEFV